MMDPHTISNVPTGPSEMLYRQPNNSFLSNTMPLTSSSPSIMQTPPQPNAPYFFSQAPPDLNQQFVTNLQSHIYGAQPIPTGFSNSLIYDNSPSSFMSPPPDAYMVDNYFGNQPNSNNHQFSSPIGIPSQPSPAQQVPQQSQSQQPFQTHTIPPSPVSFSNNPTLYMPTVKTMTTPPSQHTNTSIPIQQPFIPPSIYNYHSQSSPNLSTFHKIPNSNPSPLNNNSISNNSTNTNSNNSNINNQQTQQPQPQQPSLIHQNQQHNQIHHQTISNVSQHQPQIQHSQQQQPQQHNQSQHQQLNQSNSINSSNNIGNKIIINKSASTTNLLHSSSLNTGNINSNHINFQFPQHQFLYTLAHTPPSPLSSPSPHNSSNTSTPISLSTASLTSSTPPTKDEENTKDEEVTLKEKEDVARTAYKTWFVLKPGNKEVKDRWWALYYNKILPKYHLRDNHLGRKINQWIEEDMRELDKQGGVVAPKVNDSNDPSSESSDTKKRKPNSTKEGSLPAYINVLLINPTENEKTNLSNFCVSSSINWSENELENLVGVFKDNRQRIMDNINSKKKSLPSPSSPSTPSFTNSSIVSKKAAQHKDKKLKAKTNESNQQMIKLDINCDWVFAEVYMVNDSYWIKADLPGMEPKDFNIETDDICKFVISGERKKDVTQDVTMLIGKRKFGNFQIEAHLPLNADLGKTEHFFYNGVLSIKCPLRT